MKYEEREQDLFTVSEDYYLAHCISADFALGKGIALEFNKRFDMKAILKANNKDYLKEWRKMGNLADCILEGRVFNLVTKERYYNKPTYNSLRWSLEIMKNYCEGSEIKKIAMPVIGCGLDQLEWNKVSDIIKDIFSEMDIEILICKQKN